MLVACRQFWGTAVQKLWNFRSCSAVMVSMSLFMQFIDGCGCPCVGLLLEVPQTQFIAGAGGLSSFRDGFSSRVDGDEGVGAHHTGDELN